MPITAYVGVPRSGKTYEVVKSVVLPAIISGRRVVSNIYGLDEKKIHEYCLRKNKKLKPSDLGAILTVDNKQCVLDEFLPSIGNTDTICKAGDLVIIDEVWRVWGSEKDIPKSHKSFIAEHGHFVDKETGVMTDLVVINQSVSDIPRFLKNRIETTFRMQKHTAFGMNNRYRVDVYEHAKITKSNRITKMQEKYNKDIFTLYNSVDGNKHKQLVTDRRQSIFGNKLLMFSLIFVCVLFVIFSYKLYYFFNSSTESLVDNTVNEKTSEKVSKDYVFVQNNKISNIKPLEISAIWRIAGELTIDNKRFVILVDSSDRLRFESRSNFKFSDRLLQGFIDGKLVTYYSGATK